MFSHIELRRVDLWSLFKVAFIVYFAIGLVFGLFYGLFAVVASTIGGAFVELQEELPEGFPIGVLGGMLGLVAIPILAVGYGGFGAVFVTLAGVVYNIAARFAGGIRFETRVEGPAAPAPQQRPAPAPQQRPSMDGHEDLTPPDIDLT